jgi:hypothetical protein
MGVRHVVLLQWKETATDAKKEAAIEALRSLTGAVPGMRSYTAGLDLGVAGTHDAALVADFDDEASLKEYMSHPRHVAVINDHLAEIMASSARCQYAVEP